MSTTLAPAPGQALGRQEPLGENGLDLSSYDSQAYNILSPVLRLDTAAPYLRFRAVEVRLDPNLRLLDYVPRNDIAKVSLPGARARQTLVAVAAGVGLSVLVAAFLFRRPRRIRTGL